MLTISPGETVPKTHGSKKKVFFDCDCGRKRVQKIWKNVSSGHTSKCGLCGSVPASEWAEKKFGRLRMKEPREIHWQSSRKVMWTCDCGRETSVSVAQVASGKTSSCGRCTEMDAEFWKKSVFGKLRMLRPGAFHPNSHNEVEWECSCGRTTKAIMANVTRGLTKSCGRCSEIPVEEGSVRKFGSLRMKDPKPVKPMSEKLEVFLCDCGRETTTKVCYVMSGQTKSCGKCKALSEEEMKSRKFGRLKMESPKEVLPGSHEKVIWTCDCGGSLGSTIFNVTDGRVQSCGKCYRRVKEWYDANRESVRALKTPIPVGPILGGPIEMLETVTNTGSPVKVKCASCLSEYTPVWDNIRLGKSLTCGCTTSQTSGPALEIRDFIEKEGLEAIVEHEVDGLSYDVFVPSKNLLIEHNGLRWHSMDGSKGRDLEKYRRAAGHDFIMIFEDEWKKSRKKVESLIRNRLRTIPSIPVSPRQCEIGPVESSEANRFYDVHHYIGRCRAKIHVGAFVEGKLAACQSFARPTRQSSHPWELVRMAADPAYRIRGIWSKLFKEFLKAERPSSVVSFSDNRLFGGGVYGKIGFKLDGDVRPDYYWTKGSGRFHKSGLRKKGEEKTSGLTEYQLRESGGYRRIWDLGKKRWVWKKESQA